MLLKKDTVFLHFSRGKEDKHVLHYVYMNSADLNDILNAYNTLQRAHKILLLTILAMSFIVLIFHVISLIGWYDFDTGLFTSNTITFYVIPVVVYITIGICWLVMRSNVRTNFVLQQKIDKIWFRNYFFRVQMRYPEGENSIDKFVKLLHEEGDEVLNHKNMDQRKKNIELENQVVIDLAFSAGKDLDLSSWTKRNLSAPLHKREFFIRNFNKSVTLDDISKTVNALISKYGEKSIFRLVILSKEFDKIFFDDEDISKKIQNVSKSINLDLIQETDNKFLFIWTSLLEE